MWRSVGVMPSAMVVSHKARVTAVVAGFCVLGLAEGAGSPAAVGPPVDTSLPSISGVAQQGQSVSAGSGSWTGSPSGFFFQWQRCDGGGGNCADITGDSGDIVVGAGSVYVLRAADVGRTIRVRVTAVNSSGSASALSGAVGDGGRRRRRQWRGGVRPP